MNRFSFFLLFTAVFLFCSGCERNSSQVSYAPEYSATPPNMHTIYIFGVHPLHNPKRLHEVFGPLMEYLNSQFENTDFRLEASRNYAAYDRKLYAGHFHFALPNPYQTVNSLQHNYRVFGKMADDENFRGIILVRKDRNINNVTDLKGKAVSFPAPTALAATMLPQYYLQKHGLNVMQDIDIKYVGSQESSVMNVYLGNTVAGATWPPPWRAMSKERPELKKELKVIWQTQPLPNNALVVRNDISEEVLSKVSSLILNLHNTPEGKKILNEMELSRFESANNETYVPVIEFLEKFHNEVRPIK